jgi:hypothetical protein
MIRYDHDIVLIEAAVDAIAPQWRKEAEKRTKRFAKNKRFKEASSIWSKVKPVFMQLQHSKCAYCERQLESIEFGRIEHDLEHFRPKSNVKFWPPTNWPKTYNFPMGGASPRGYYWLPYNLSNYAAACKVCNSPLKSDFFPIAGRRATTRRSSTRLMEEKAYLCYPIGHHDDDPESLITFIATTAVPTARSGHKRNRGEVIIDFFQLNEREQLHRERARMISLLGNALKMLEAGIDVEINNQVAASLSESHIPHSACLRAYRRIWGTDKPLAKTMHSVCQVYAVSLEGTKPPTFD